MGKQVGQWRENILELKYDVTMGQGVGEESAYQYSRACWDDLIVGRGS